MDVKKTREHFHNRYGKGYLTWEELIEIDGVLIALEACQAQLAEAQTTIRIAYSDVPDKGYDAEATLRAYMDRHGLEEW